MKATRRSTSNGIGGDTDRFGRACLTARRHAERGVRSSNSPAPAGNHHNNLKQGLTDRFRDIDRPIAGLLADLKRRGLLKDTLVIWAASSWRGSSDDKGDGNGRGHNVQGFTCGWPRRRKRGFRYGRAPTNSVGRAVDGIVGVHDLHATILHLLGLDHTRLTFNYAGRDFRLTETEGTVAKAILA